MKNNLPGLKRISSEALIGAIYDLKETKKHGLRSNLKGLDNQIGGIWRDGIVIQGLPDSGKTVLSKNLAVSFCIGGNRVIDVDLENDERENLINITLIFLAMLKGKGAPTRGELMERPAILSEAVNVDLLEKHLYPFYHYIGAGADKITEDAMEGWMAGLTEGQTRGSQVALFLDSLHYLAKLYPIRNIRDPLESVEQWIAALGRIKSKWQMPVFIIPHRLKSTQGMDEMMELKGSSSIPHFARTQIKLERVAPGEVKVKILRAQFGSRESMLLRLDQLRLLLTEYEDGREW